MTTLDRLIELHTPLVGEEACPSCGDVASPCPTLALVLEMANRRAPRIIPGTRPEFVRTWRWMLGLHDRKHEAWRASLLAKS